MKHVVIAKFKTIDYLSDTGREQWTKDRSLFTKYVQ